MTKTAIILFNLGGPDKRESIKPFLKNFFMDKNIIQAPYPVRVLVSSLIAMRRSKKEAGDSYAALGHRSPLLDNTLAQARALEQTLAARRGPGKCRVFTVMRYWHPFSHETLSDVMDWGADDIVLLPLYPQFSTTTTWSSAEDWSKACRRAKFIKPTRIICCYPFNDGFIQASAQNIRASLDEFASTYPGVKPRVLFSAHGLPEKIIDGGDPYQWQCEESARRIAAATGIENLDWSICYQSRVGPLKWIGPSTTEALQQAARDGVGVVIYPHAFVSEHVETLVEIEMEYRAEAEHLGIKGFARVPTVSTSPEFINGLADLIDDAGQSSGFHAPRICPAQFSRCCQACGAALNLSFT